MSQNPSTISSRHLFGQMILSSRPISWINTAFPFAAGYLASGGSLSWYFIVATLYFLIPYNFLVYIVNDVYDYESDIKNPRKNSIEGGILPPDTHNIMLGVTALLNVVFLGYLLIFSERAPAIILALVAVAAISYSWPPLRFKERPLLDSINSSIHFVGPLVFALALTGWNQSYWPYVMAFFLWGCASHAFGAVQDIVPDRQAGIISIATRFGARRTVVLSFWLYVLAGACIVLAGWPSIVMCLPLALYVAMVFPYRNLSDNESSRANAGWRRFLLLNQLSGFTATLLLIFSYLH